MSSRKRLPIFNKSPYTHIGHTTAMAVWRRCILSAALALLVCATLRKALVTCQSQTQSTEEDPTQVALPSSSAKLALFLIVVMILIVARAVCRYRGQTSTLLSSTPSPEPLPSPNSTEISPAPPSPSPSPSPFTNSTNSTEQIPPGMVISQKHLDRIAREFLTNWEELSSSLGLSEQQEHNIHKTNREYADQKREVLRTWKRNEGNGATYGAFIAAAEEISNMQLADNVRSLLQGPVFSYNQYPVAGSISFESDAVDLSQVLGRISSDSDTDDSVPDSISFAPDTVYLGISTTEDTLVRSRKGQITRDASERRHSLGLRDISDVHRKLLPIADKWKQFGIQLGISFSGLKLMYTGSEGYLFWVLEMWFKTEQSWESLVAALNHIGEPALADRIAKHYGKEKGRLGKDLGDEMTVQGHLKDLTKEELKSLFQKLGLSATSVGTRYDSNVNVYRANLVRLWILEDDRVQEKGGATWESLRGALKSIGKTEIADKIQYL